MSASKPPPYSRAVMQLLPMTRVRGDDKDLA